MADTVTPKRISIIAVAARVPLPESSPARIANAVAPVVARMAQGDIAVALELEPSNFVAIARNGAKQ